MIVLLFVSAHPVFAKKQKETVVNQSDFYIGGGVSYNDLDNFDEAIGLQVFGGYDLPVELRGSMLSVEVGYWDSGDFEKRVPPGFTVETSANGLWATAVWAVHLSQSIDLLARLGYDFGDDDGLMGGIGGGFDLNPTLQLRVEFVARDDIDSLQANFVYHF
jgi:hypothetical protein